ncbi:hypothetical protein EV127DRAFT_408571 [Xylaria flabelliformis]|nr:hypothetical protein EV127DRAFT_408571 [Xylaria flabelliformis]
MNDSHEIDAIGDANLAHGGDEVPNPRYRLECRTLNSVAHSEDVSGGAMEISAGIFELFLLRFSNNSPPSAICSCMFLKHPMREPAIPCTYSIQLEVLALALHPSCTLSLRPNCLRRELQAGTTREQQEIVINQFPLGIKGVDPECTKSRRRATREPNVQGQRGEELDARQAARPLPTREHAWCRCFVMIGLDADSVAKTKKRLSKLVLSGFIPGANVLDKQLHEQNLDYENRDFPEEEAQSEKPDSLGV